MQKRTMKQRIAIGCSVIAMLGTTVAGALLSAPKTVTAEETASTSHSFTLSEAIGMVTYTEEELTASELEMSKGVLGDPESTTAYATSNLTTEQLEKKETFYKTAFDRSPLEFYAAFKNDYAQKEYWQWAVDKSNSYRFSWTHINGLSAGHSGTTDSRINAKSNHCIYYNSAHLFTYSFGWTAPADGVLTIPEHTLTLETGANFKLGFSQDDGNRATLSPTDSSLGWKDYTTGSYTIEEQSFRVEKGQMVYINMYADGATGWIGYYNPTFTFRDQVDSESYKTTLTDEIGKVAYTDAELSASGWDGSATNNANREALLKLASEKSDLKYYAFAGTESDYKTWEYYQWAGNGSGYFFNWTTLNTIYVWSKSTEYGLHSNGTHGIGGSGAHNQAWVVAWTAPADGVLTIPEHTLTVSSFSTNATALNLGWTVGDYITPFTTNPTWTTYTETGEYTIAKQTFKVSAGDTIYLNMYSNRTEGSAQTTIRYNPTFDFVDVMDIPENPYETVETTLAKEIAKVGYTEEEKTASSWDGSSRDANKEALYQVAFAKSDLKYYVGPGSGIKEYYQWAEDGSTWKWSWSSINNLSVGNSGGTSYGLTASGDHVIGGAGDYNHIWIVGWTAPADGVLTIPEHTLNVKSFAYTATALDLGWTVGKYITPSDTNPTWATYTEKGEYTIAEQTFKVSAGDMVYLNMYTERTVTEASKDAGVAITYNPTFSFMPTAGEMEGATLSTTSDIGLNFYADMELGTEEVVATAESNGSETTVNGVYDEGKALWKFTVPVAAKDFDQDVTLTIKEVNGKKVNGAKYTFSVADYMNYVLEDTTGAYDSVKAVVENLNNYCEVANAYFNSTGETVEKVTEEVVSASDLSEYKASVTGEDENIELKGATLVLESKTTINVYFVTDEGTAATVAGAVKVEGQENLYVVKAEVVAQDLGVAQTFTIGGYTVTYSAFSYIETCVDKAGASLYNVLQALYDYGTAAANYFKA